MLRPLRRPARRRPAARRRRRGRRPLARHAPHRQPAAAPGPRLRRGARRRRRRPARSPATALAVYDVDELGLDRLDRAVLDALVRRFGGGPVGLSTLAVAVSEEAETVEEVAEPFLVRTGLVAPHAARPGRDARRPGPTSGCRRRARGRRRRPAARPRRRRLTVGSASDPLARIAGCATDDPRRQDHGRRSALQQLLFFAAARRPLPPRHPAAAGPRPGAGRRCAPPGARLAGHDHRRHPRHRRRRSRTTRSLLEIAPGRAGPLRQRRRSCAARRAGR